MRIGLVIYGNLDTLSGGYLYDRKLVEFLRDEGDEVEIISIPWRNYAAHLTDNFSPSLLGRLDSPNFDVLIQDELNHPSLFLLNRRLKSLVNYPIISIVHHLRSCETVKCLKLGTTYILFLLHILVLQTCVYYVRWVHCKVLILFYTYFDINNA